MNINSQFPLDSERIFMYNIYEYTFIYIIAYSSCFVKLIFRKIYGMLMEKVILHCDFNSYYASVETLYNEKLRNIPMAVCGDPALRHGIILAQNDIAKKMGVTTGESIYSAKQKVPSLTTVTADYPKYVSFAKKARELFRECSNEVIPFGLDEAWIVLPEKVDTIEKGAVIADELRYWIKSELGLTASVGVSFNYVFSKLASDMKKPDATTTVSKDDLKPVIWNLPAYELLFVGPATRKKLMNMGILTIGDLARCNVKTLKRVLGKNGETLWMFANGDDRAFDPKTPENDPFKSIGNTLTMPYDLMNELDILTMLYILSKTVSARLTKHKLKAKCIGILIKYSNFATINRQLTPDLPIDNEQDIFKSVKRLFSGNFDKNPVRSIGVHVSKLQNSQFEQLSLFNENEDNFIDEIKSIEINLSEKLKELRVEKYFNFNFAEESKLCAEDI